MEEVVEVAIEAEVEVSDVSEDYSAGYHVRSSSSEALEEIEKGWESIRSSGEIERQGKTVSLQNYMCTSMTQRREHSTALGTSSPPLASP